MFSATDHCSGGISIIIKDSSQKYSAQEAQFFICCIAKPFLAFTADAAASLLSPNPSTMVARNDTSPRSICSQTKSEA